MTQFKKIKLALMTSIFLPIGAINDNSSFRPMPTERRPPKWPLNSEEKEILNALSGYKKRAYIKHLKYKYEG